MNRSEKTGITENILRLVSSIYMYESPSGSLISLISHSVSLETNTKKTKTIVFKALIKKFKFYYKNTETDMVNQCSYLGFT